MFGPQPQRSFVSSCLRGFLRISTASYSLHIPEAVDRVIVDHADCLHERVADCRPDELEASTLKILAQRIGLRRSRRNLHVPPPPVHARRPADKCPDIGIEAP